MYCWITSRRSLTLGCSFAEDDLSQLAFALPLGASGLSMEHPKEATHFVHDSLSPDSERALDPKVLWAAPPEDVKASLCGRVQLGQRDQVQ